MCACTLYFQKLESFLSLIVWVYLYSNLCSGLQKTHLFYNRVRFGRSRSFSVIQGRWFWYQSKARMRFTIIRSLGLWSYLAPFLWPYGDLLAKNCLFFPTPLSFGAPTLEFRAEINHEETRVMGLSYIEGPVIVAWAILTQCQRVTDRRTDLL